MSKVCLAQVRPYSADKTKNMRGLSPEDIDQLITINGMVTRASDLIPEMCETSCSWSCQLSKGGPGPDIHLTMPLSLNIFFNHLYLIRQDGGGILDVKQLVDFHVQCRYDLSCLSTTCWTSPVVAPVVS